MRLEFGNPLPVLQSDKMHQRVRAAYRKAWHKRVAEQVMLSGARPREPWGPADILCVRHSAVEPDYDGVVNSFKPLIDGLIKARVIVDDRPSALGPGMEWQEAAPRYQWKRAPRGEGRVTITVRPL